MSFRVPFRVRPGVARNGTRSSRAPREFPAIALARDEPALLELHERVRKILEELQTRTHADSLTEVLRRAVFLYQRLMDKVESGCRIVARAGDEERELIIECALSSGTQKEFGNG